MKKLIFLLLLAQTISFLYGDAHCMGYKQVTGHQGIDSDKDDPLAWRWGIKAPQKVRCDCNCAQHKQANYVCTGCNHKHLPTALPLSTATAVQAKHTHHNKSNTNKAQLQAKKIRAKQAKTKKTSQKSTQNS